MPEKKIKPVAAVERAFLILEAFRSGRLFLSLAELSEKTKLYKSTILRLLQTLERLGYVIRNANGEYHVGPTIFQLGGFYQAAMKPEDVVVPVLRALVAETNESAGFHIRFGNQRLCLYRVDSPHPLRDHFKPGDALPLERGAGGKILTAFTKPYKPQYMTLHEKLVVSASGEIASDMSGVASPSFDSSGDLAGAVTLSGPSTRFNRKSLPHFEECLLQAARKITEALGGDPRPFAKALALRSKGSRTTRKRA